MQRYVLNRHTAEHLLRSAGFMPADTVTWHNATGQQATIRPISFPVYHRKPWQGFAVEMPLGV